MAKVRNNIVTKGLSGLLGDQIVFRNDKTGRTIVAMRPTFNGERVFNASQLAHQDAFRQAIAFAKTAKNNPVYVAKAEGTVKSAYNLAVADWFTQPEVLDIDASGWTGLIGETIRIKADDTTHVSRVHLLLDNAQGTIFEQSDLVRSDGMWWIYTTTTQVPMSPAPRLVGTAYDLPGNNNGKVWSDN